MKKILVCLIAALLILACVENSQAVLGIPDHVPAATLILPMFEVQIDPGVSSLDTLPVVQNSSGGAVTVHFEVWDVNGCTTTDLFGNFTLASAETVSFTMRGMIEAASAATRAQLTDGAFYRGFMTFDVVTVATALTPVQGGYPFSSTNALAGWTYYVRLLQGSSNGISMVPLEAAPGGSIFLVDFYQLNDAREEIDATSRYSADQLTLGGAVAFDPDASITRVHSRVFLDPGLNGSSRIVIFTFPQEGAGLCGGGGPGVVPYLRYDEVGNLLENTTVNLNRIVNVINVSGTSNGFVSIWNIPDFWSTYGFSINAANPGFNPALTWDAIFESYMTH